MGKKIIINERLLRPLLMEMVKERYALNEISAADAYRRFYSNPDSIYISPDDYAALMDGTKDMTPFHKMILDAMVKGDINGDVLPYAGNIWRNASREAKMYILNSVKDDKDFLTRNPDNLKNFLKKVSEMRAHTDTQFYNNGFEILYEDDNIKVTTTKSYTSSCKEYGASHWCTASDIFGEYNGFSMFCSYAGGDCFLIQFVDKRDIPSGSFQAQYGIRGSSCYNLCVFNWDDQEVSEQVLAKHLRERGVNYMEIFDNYIRPNAVRISKETNENIKDEEDYYERQCRIRTKNLFNRINKEVNSKEFEQEVMQVFNEIDAGGSPRCDISAGKVCVRNLDDVNDGLADYYILTIYYNGTDAVYNMIQRMCEDNDDWCNLTTKIWIVDKNHNVIKRIDGELINNYGNFAVYTSFGWNGFGSLYNMKTGKVEVNLIYQTEKILVSNRLVLYVGNPDDTYEGGEPTERIFDVRTGEEVNDYGTPRIDEAFQYFSNMPKGAIIQRPSREWDGTLEFVYVYSTLDYDRLLVSKDYSPGGIITHFTTEKGFNRPRDVGHSRTLYSQRGLDGKVVALSIGQKFMDPRFMPKRTRLYCENALGDITNYDFVYFKIRIGYA